MTNKQIIIDDVDVSGCKIFNNKWGTPLCNPTEDIREAVHCSDSPNCLYKQHKRKEQECEELTSKCSQLKQTLAEIKKIMKKHCRKCKKHKFYHFQLCCTCKYTDILQKISEVENEKNNS